MTEMIMSQMTVTHMTVTAAIHVQSPDSATPMRYAARRGSMCRLEMPPAHRPEYGNGEKRGQGVKAGDEMNTTVQLPVVCLRNAAAGPPRIEPTPWAI